MIFDIISKGQKIVLESYVKSGMTANKQDYNTGSPVNGRPKVKRKTMARRQMYDKCK